MVRVRIGAGEGEQFEVWVDGEWSVVPRVGEKIYFRRERLPTQVVRKVSYLVDEKDGLIGAMVTVA
jgi:hypothetical protein